MVMPGCTGSGKSFKVKEEYWTWSCAVTGYQRNDPEREYVICSVPWRKNAEVIEIARSKDSIQRNGHVTNYGRDRTRSFSIRVYPFVVNNLSVRQAERHRKNADRPQHGNVYRTISQMA
jgi:hypothetical protein